MDENRNLENNIEEVKEEMAAENEAVEAVVEETVEEAAEEQVDENGKKKMTLKQKIIKEIREWIVALAVALVVVLVIQSFLFRIIRVDGASMNPTLVDGERLFVTVADVRFGDVDRDSIVICHYPNRGMTYFVKRCVGVPGDTVYCQNGVTHVVYTDEDGNTVDEPLDERYAIYAPFGSPSDYEPYVLGEDEYFVVGDNRYNSHDSRDWKDKDPSGDVGPISKKMIVGRVRNVIWPLSDIRSVD
ncbi:MAG: signal peptidase I [Clostridiales bacterium]|nr:signal peptidase I [Clostridiales bacterium]